MTNLLGFYFEVCREGGEDDWEELFHTEIRYFFREEEIESKLKEWQRELELRYFPVHTLLHDMRYSSILELGNGLQMGFSAQRVRDV